jgi:hypothetical protein
VVFDPLEFLGRLAVLVPPPGINLLLYHGVLGARATWRAEVVRHGRSDPAGETPLGTVPATADRDRDTWDQAARRARGACGAALMQRTFGVDLLACPPVWGPVASHRAHRPGDHVDHDLAGAAFERLDGDQRRVPVAHARYREQDGASTRKHLRAFGDLSRVHLHQLFGFPPALDTRQTPAAP